MRTTATLANLARATLRARQTHQRALGRYLVAQIEAGSPISTLSSAGSDMGVRELIALAPVSRKRKLAALYATQDHDWSNT